MGLKEYLVAPFQRRRAAVRAHCAEAAYAAEDLIRVVRSSPHLAQLRLDHDQERVLDGFRARPEIGRYVRDGSTLTVALSSSGYLPVAHGSVMAVTWSMSGRRILAAEIVGFYGMSERVRKLELVLGSFETPMEFLGTSGATCRSFGGGSRMRVEYPNGMSQQYFRLGKHRGRDVYAGNTAQAYDPTENLLSLFSL